MYYYLLHFIATDCNSFYTGIAINHKLIAINHTFTIELQLYSIFFAIYCNLLQLIAINSPQEL